MSDRRVRPEEMQMRDPGPNVCPHCKQSEYHFEYCPLYQDRKETEEAGALMELEDPPMEDILMEVANVSFQEIERLENRLERAEEILQALIQAVDESKPHQSVPSLVHVVYNAADRFLNEGEE